MHDREEWVEPLAAMGAAWLVLALVVLGPRRTAKLATGVVVGHALRKDVGPGVVWVRRRVEAWGLECYVGMPDMRRIVDLYPAPEV